MIISFVDVGKKMMKMNNISIRRKNNIYKIYSKLNNSYRLYIIERDGQKKAGNEKQIKIEPKKEKIQNRPCDMPILAVYRKKIWLQFKKIIYKPIPCLIYKNQIINSRKKIEDDIQEEIDFQKRMEAERILLEKEITKYNEREKKRREEKRIEREKEKQKERASIEKKYKELDKVFRKKTLELKEKLQALKEKKWFGQTSNGSNICFYGLEYIDYVDLGNEYIELIVYNILKSSGIKINWNPSSNERLHFTKPYVQEFRKVVNLINNTRYQYQSVKELKKLIENIYEEN